MQKTAEHIENTSSNDVLSVVRSIAKFNYNTGDLGRIIGITDDIIRLYAGKFDNYQACDVPYHNLEHTIQIINPFAEIIDEWNKAKQEPNISFRFFELGIIAVLLHDTGYIKKADDNHGTGGKYTFAHIGRGVIFAEEYLASRSFANEEITTVSNMILCTGLTEKHISFLDDEERVCGHALGTADLVGQLSAHNYFEKLPGLFEEFREAYDYEGREKLKERHALMFADADELIDSTPSFYTNVVLKKFEQMGHMNKYVNKHYLPMIEKNIEKVRSRCHSN